MRRQIVLFAALLAAGCITQSADPDRVFVDEAKRVENLRAFDEIWMHVGRSYLNPSRQQPTTVEAQQLPIVNWQTIGSAYQRRIEQAAVQGDVRIAMREAIGRLGQSHFTLLPADLKIDEGRSAFRAVGPETGLTIRLDGNTPVVTHVAPNSPAASAGVRVGWTLHAIDDEDAAAIVERLRTALPPDRLAESRIVEHLYARLSGETPGQRVRAMFRNPLDERRPLQLAVLTAAPPADVETKIEGKRLSDGTLYLAIDAFLEPAKILAAFDRLRSESPDARGLIIDLRGNAGGLTSAATDLLGRLVPVEAKIGVLIRRDAALPLNVVSHDPVFDGKTVVLVDAFTMSTAEIFARAIQDTGRGIVIGQPTPGVTQPSVVVRLANGERFQYPPAEYISISGQRLEGIGITPEQEMRFDRNAVLRGHDPSIEAAQAWLWRQLRP